MSYSNLNPAWDRMHKTHYLQDVTPPRCVKCNEPVSMNKRDCACTRDFKPVMRQP